MQRCEECVAFISANKSLHSTDSYLNTYQQYFSRAYRHVFYQASACISRLSSASPLSSALADFSSLLSGRPAARSYLKEQLDQYVKFRLNSGDFFISKKTLEVSQ
ncbi:hypothetical protein GEMRC1_007309 [Eukaryota sp. GEM-RC1]